MISEREGRGTDRNISDERETSIGCTSPPGTEPKTQARALTRNQTLTSRFMGQRSTI